MKRTKCPLIAIITLIAAFPVAGYTQTTRAVDGTIYSGRTRQPIPAATITSKATGMVSASDSAGRFAFSGLPHTDTLSVACLGYESREISIAGSGKGSIEVLLEESIKHLDEVVVNTGYQTLPRERATGSFTSIDNSLFNRSVSTDLISRLEGVTNGLAYELPNTSARGEPAVSPDLRVRGVSTIRGETGPLIVVDNFPYEGDIANINPNDVEQITVLKDAAAASIWGARAGNGVIVITTKSGSLSSRPQINVNTNISIAEKPDLYYSRTFLPSAEYVALERVLFDKGLYAKNDWTAYTPAIDILFARDEGVLDGPKADNLLVELKQYDIRDEAARQLYRQSVNQQYAVNINGGSERHRYYVSAGFDNNASNLIGNNSKRVTVSARNDFEPLPKLKINTSFNYMQGRATTNGISLSELTPTGMGDPYVYMRLADEEGNALPVVKNNRFGYTDSAVGVGLLDWHYRPLDELHMGDNTSTTQEIRLNSAIRYQLLGGLSAEARYQYQSIVGAARNHYVEESYTARHEINRFTQSDGSRPVPFGGILDRSNRSFSSHYGRLQLDYNGLLADSHHLNGLAGVEIRQERNEYHGASRLYGYDDDILAHVTNLNFDTPFPVRPRFSGRIPNGNTSGTHIVDRFVSYYANLAYTYNTKYIFSGSIRWDASNIFGVDFNQKGVPLWSVGAAWNANEEPFLDTDWLDMVKLRITYGSNGNAVRWLSSLPYIWYVGSNNITGLPMGTMRSVGNPDLSWERVNTINLGLDFGLFGRRVTGSIELYEKRATNLIGEYAFDPTVGIFLSGISYNLENRRNYANLTTSGVDIELNTVNIDRALRWETTVLFSKVRNRVTNYRNPREPLATDFFGSVATMPLIVSRPIDQLYALPWYGLDSETGAPQVMVDNKLSTDYNAYFNGLTQEDVIRAGVSMPPYFGSLRNTFTWRSFSVSANILWKAGHKFRRSTILYGNLFGSAKTTHIDYLDRWQQAGDELYTNVPSMPESADVRRDQAYMWSEAVLERGDHIRLQDISLSYVLPRDYTRRIGLSQIRLYGYARNLGILWKYTDYDVDPDVRAMYPNPLQLSFGLQIQL